MLSWVTNKKRIIPLGKAAKFEIRNTTHNWSFSWKQKSGLGLIHLCQFYVGTWINQSFQKLGICELLQYSFLSFFFFFERYSQTQHQVVSYLLTSTQIIKFNTEYHKPHLSFPSFSQKVESLQTARRQLVWNPTLKMM